MNLFNKLHDDNYKYVEGRLIKNRHLTISQNHKIMQSLGTEITIDDN